MFVVVRDGEKTNHRPLSTKISEYSQCCCKSNYSKTNVKSNTLTHALNQNCRLIVLRLQASH
jgi:hypothetical protein